MPRQGEGNKAKKKVRRRVPRKDASLNNAQSSVTSSSSVSASEPLTSTAKVADVSASRAHSSNPSAGVSSYSAIGGLLSHSTQGAYPTKGFRTSSPKKRTTKIASFKDASYASLRGYLSTPVSDCVCKVRRTDLDGLELSSVWKGKSEVEYSIYRNPFTRAFIHSEIIDDSIQGYASEITKERGWKIHVSLDDTQDDENLERGWDITRKHLAAHQIKHFKIVDHQSRKKLASDPKQAGKSITIYVFKDKVVNDEQWQVILQNMTIEFVNADVRPGPSAPEGDIQVQGSHYFSFRNDEEDSFMRQSLSSPRFGGVVVNCSSQTPFVEIDAKTQETGQQNDVPAGPKLGF